MGASENTVYQMKPIASKPLSDSSFIHIKLLKYAPFIIGFIIVTTIAVVLTLQIQDWLSQPPTKKKKVTRIISLIQPKPPEPEIKEIPEQKIEEQIETPDLDQPIPDIPDDVPMSDLGLDTEGEGAGDDYGLVGHKGGNGLLDGADPHSGYKQLMSSVLTELLNKNEKINKLEYIVELRIWVGLNGKITRFQIVKSTGVKILDQEIMAAIPRNMDFGQQRPPGMQSAITLKISSRK